MKNNPKNLPKFFFIAGGMNARWYMAILEDSLVVSYKVKHILPQNPEIMFLGICLTDLKTMSTQPIRVCNVANWKQSCILVFYSQKVRAINLHNMDKS